MTLTPLDAIPALIVVDLQEGLLSLPTVHPIAGNRSVAIREDAGNPDILTGQRAYFWGLPRTIGINFRAAL